LLAASLIVAGCGDDSGSSSGGDTTAGSAATTAASGGATTAAGGGSDTTAAATGETKTLVIADLESLTGPGASVGVPQANASKMAVDEINAAGGINVGGTTYMLELDTKDDESDPTVGVTNVQRFLSDGRNYMVGTLSSAVVGAYLPIVQDLDDFISIVDGAALEGITEHESVYRPRVTLSQYTVGLSDYLKQRGDVTSIAMLTDQQHAGFVQQKQPLIDRLKEKGIETVADESYTFGATDFGAQVSAMLRANPDALNLRGYPADITRVIKQARDQGFTGPIFTTSGITQKEVDDAQAASAMDGVIEVYAPLPSDLIQGGRNAENAQKFEENYTKAFGEPPGGTSMSAYGAVYILARALEKAGTVDDVAAVREALDSLTLDDVPELVEPIKPQEGGRIFADRQAHFVLVVREWKDGAFVPTEFVD
jgi:branched-chain amino acid transport system substrate-binding protein